MTDVCLVATKAEGPIPSQRLVVERAEAYLRANLSHPLRVSRLSRLLGVSERGLRNAFYGVRGMGPKRRMLALRLQGVHRALIDPAPDSTTVTRVATGYGFYELGRFAATYKNAFGEAPSETLYGAARKHARGPHAG